MLLASRVPNRAQRRHGRRGRGRCDDEEWEGGERKEEGGRREEDSPDRGEGGRKRKNGWTRGDGDGESDDGVSGDDESDDLGHMGHGRGGLATG
ncbi:hypothetical protein ACLOJK_020794 [Asimina triloba]